ncbi:hypothetical protein BN11_1350003 [Nostocoides australiense Ben110]|uniref:Uncharacterized protein n=1 Tax=Nostocoides australiense Ben110 TaxID=1193182 RepID=W6JSQ8_9MICO|nr:hypothetical protein BN11_1350003 [Tetrasphaera australiensis Ben110]
MVSVVDSPLSGTDRRYANALGHIFCSRFNN